VVFKCEKSIPDQVVTLPSLLAVVKRRPSKDHPMARTSIRFWRPELETCAAHKAVEAWSPASSLLEHTKDWESWLGDGGPGEWLHRVQMLSRACARKATQPTHAAHVYFIRILHTSYLSIVAMGR